MRAKRRTNLEVEGLESRTVLSGAHHGLHGAVEVAALSHRGPIVSGTIRGTFQVGQVNVGGQNVPAILFNGNGFVRPLGGSQAQGAVVQSGATQVQGELALAGQRGNLLLELQSAVPTSLRRFPRIQVGIIAGSGAAAGLQGFGFATLRAGHVAADQTSGNASLSLRMATIR